MATSQREALQALSFGQRVAEEEQAELAAYFVRTEHWRKLQAGQADIVYGQKGAGKSALYTYLLSQSADFDRRGLILIAGENPRGTPAFRDLVADPPTSEPQFVSLWKLYFLQLIADRFAKDQSPPPGIQDAIAHLRKAGLLPPGGGLRAYIRAALDYIRTPPAPSGVEATLNVDPVTGLPSGITGRITFTEPSLTAMAAGAVSLESLFRSVDEDLAKLRRTIWLMLDRLDVAFSESLDLEQNGLRALFHAYADLRPYTRIVPKIFLRTDIWERITQQGFREASHITNAITISWDTMSLINLVIRRAIQNPVIANFYVVRPSVILANFQEQAALFYRIFPKSMHDFGRAQPTFDWILTRIQDGAKAPAPRELIHLLSESRNVQIRRAEVGESFPVGETLITQEAIREALIEVSRTRLNQTFLAEHPSMREVVLALKGGKPTHTLETLQRVWDCDRQRALSLATSLTELGFFARRADAQQLEYWIPFIYHDALDVVLTSSA